MLPAPARSSGGHRLYHGAHLKRLTSILRGNRLERRLTQMVKACESAGAPDCPVLDELCSVA